MSINQLVFIFFSSTKHRSNHPAMFVYEITLCCYYKTLELIHHNNSFSLGNFHCFHNLASLTLLNYQHCESPALRLCIKMYFQHTIRHNGSVRHFRLPLSCSAAFVTRQNSSAGRNSWVTAALDVVCYWAKFHYKTELEGKIGCRWFCTNKWPHPTSALWLFLFVIFCLLQSFVKFLSYKTLIIH